MKAIVKPKYWRKNTSLKNVFIESKEWFDRINGNSYGSSRVTVNDGLKNSFSFNVPFCYGYGNYQEQRVFEKLVKHGILDKEYRREYDKFKVTFIKHENCLKREVKHWGETL